MTVTLQKKGLNTDVIITTGDLEAVLFTVSSENFGSNWIPTLQIDSDLNFRLWWDYLCM